METRVTTNKTPARKAAAKTKPAAESPFAEMVEPAPVKKVTAKKAAAPVAKAKPVRKAKAAVAVDPFAELADAAPTVKKRATRTVKAKEAEPKKTVRKTTRKAAAVEETTAVSPTFKALSEPVLPELPRENRARLQMQSPVKLYFYWSVKENPFQMLRQAFGQELGSYQLVLKLTNLTRDTEELYPADTEGNWWFDVSPGSEYRAEIGFYATNRPYFRIIYSNTVETPRRNPSPRAATDADWKVSANKFAEVLDVAGFTQDAFDVAIAGDDYEAAQDSTYIAFSQLVGGGAYDLDSIAAEDIRYAMIALASGVSLADLRSRISPALFAILQANAEKMGAGEAMTALTEHFDIDETELTEEQFGPAVFGASLIHFPKTLRSRKVTSTLASRYNPLSSHSFR